MRILPGNSLGRIIGQLMAAALVYLVAGGVLAGQSVISIFGREMTIVIAAMLIVSLMITTQRMIEQPFGYLVMMTMFLAFSVIGKNVGLYRGSSIGLAIYLILIVIYLYDTEFRTFKTGIELKKMIKPKEKNRFNQ